MNEYDELKELFQNVRVTPDEETKQETKARMLAETEKSGHTPIFRRTVLKMKEKVKGTGEKITENIPGITKKAKAKFKITRQHWEGAVAMLLVVAIVFSALVLIPGVNLSGTLFKGNEDAPMRALTSDLSALAADWDLPALDDMKTGQAVYDLWMQISAKVTQKVESCMESYNEAGTKLNTLEDSIKRCHAEGDRLKYEYETVNARERELSAKISAVQNSIGNMERIIQDTQRRILDLKKLKGISKTIDNTIMNEQEQLKNIEQERTRQQAKLTSLKNEGRVYIQGLTEITQKIAENKSQIIKLEAERASYQAQMNNARKETIQWKEREQYYLNLKGEMKHLVAIEADVLEFRKLIASNPPTFQLAE